MKPSLKDFPEKLYAPLKGPTIYDHKAELLNITATTWKWYIDFKKELERMLSEIGKDQQIPQDIERDLSLLLQEILGDFSVADKPVGDKKE